MKKEAYNFGSIFRSDDGMLEASVVLSTEGFIVEYYSRGAQVGRKKAATEAIAEDLAEDFVQGISGTPDNRRFLAE